MPEKEDSPKTPPQTGAKSYILVLLMACFVGGGATMWYLARRSGEQGDRAPASSGKIKNVIHLEDFVVNLADHDNRAFVKIGIDIGQTEMPRAARNELVPSPVPAMRDVILTVLARYQSDELLTAEGKIKLKRELLQAVQERVPEADAAEIYFTEFLVQR
jgi:flagellar basal body-associated protein FliL